jgi:hypothetical protein
VKKFLALIALFSMFASTAHAGIQLSEDGTRKGQFHKLNLTDGLTVSSSGDLGLDTDVNIDGGTIDNTVIGGSTGAAGTFTIATSTYYGRLPYYSRLTMIGSGAPAGSMLVRGGPATKNCGIGGDGTTVYQCVSDGENWYAV